MSRHDDLTAKDWLMLVPWCLAWSVVGIAALWTLAAMLSFAMSLLFRFNEKVWPERAGRPQNHYTFEQRLKAKREEAYNTAILRHGPPSCPCPEDGR